MDTINEIYKKLSYINSFNKIGLKNYKKTINKTTYYFLPNFLSTKNEDSWVASFKLSYYLIKEVNKQIYYDLVVLGIDDISKRPRCKYCNAEAKFDLKVGYLSYCDKHRYNHIGEINREHFIGIPLSKEHRKKLSAAKLGKKLTPEQLKKRPRGYHFNLTEEARRKISESKKGKVMSRSYYKSGVLKLSKCAGEINYLSSYERDFLILCEKNKFIKTIEIPDPIEYKLNGKIHNYYPDFLITLDSGNKIIVEVKCLNMINEEKVIVKRLAGKAYCHSNNMKYITLTQNDIYNKRKEINYSLRLYDYFY